MADADLVIRNCSLVDGRGVRAGGVAVAGERIVAVDPDGMMPPAARVIDGRGRYLLPGILDAHVHFRDPGLTHKEDFPSATRAAAVGGITTIIEMPNTDPPVTSGERMRAKMAHLKGRGYVDYGLLAQVVRENLDAIPELAEAGAVGYKIFMTPMANGTQIPPDDGGLLVAMERIARTGLPLGVHAENPQIVEAATARLRAQGDQDPVAHAEGRPALAEIENIQRLLLFARSTGCRLHIHHLSVAEGVDLVRQAKRDGLSVTTETCPHYLLFTGPDMARLGSASKCNPPFRTPRDIAALWEGLTDGTIDFVASDHAPHALAEKIRPVIWDAAAGLSGVQFLFPLMLHQVAQGRLTLPALVRLLAESPARHYGLASRKGALAIGMDADMTLVDLGLRKTIRAEDMESRTKQTVYEGLAVQGWPILTVLGGRIVMEAGKITTPDATGRLLWPGVG